MTHRCDILPGGDPASIEHAAELLRRGGLVGMPTETVYGLAANALDPAAVARVFEAKGRPRFDPLIVHVGSAADAGMYALINPVAQQLAEVFWPGPMTLVLPRRRADDGQPVVPDLVSAGLDTVALRMPDHPVASALLARAGLPLAAPSANRFGSISPTLARHVVDELSDRVDTVLDGGACSRGVESTVVRVQDDAVEVLRLGALSIEAIERCLGRSVALLEPSSSPGLKEAGTPMPAPGMAQRHYAPRTRMRVTDPSAGIPKPAVTSRIGMIGMGHLPADEWGFVEVRNLSVSGDLGEAAANLFAMLRELDAMGLDEIVALRVPDEGLGRAINDRLSRGSAR